jgi:nucleoside-diphosphate-sugar epimerase
VHETPSILISGGAGFIGRECARDLLTRGLRVVVIDDLSAGDERELACMAPGAEFLRFDLRDQSELSGVLLDAGPFHTVLHLAGRVGVSRVLQDPQGCRSLTRELAQSLAGALGNLPRAQRPRLLAASTSEVYLDSPGPLDENAPLRSPDGQGRWAYAGSRVEAEGLFDRVDLADREGRGPIHLRFFNVTGPGHDPAVGMVLPRFIQAAQAGRLLPVYGDGLQERTFAHVRDIARDLGDLIERCNTPAGPLNLGGVAHTTVLGLAQMVLMEAGRSVGDIECLDPREVHPSFEEVRHRAPQLNRARQLGLALAHCSLSQLVEEMFASAADDPTAADPSSPRPSPLCALPAS